jgi:hypothetical protein
MRADFFRKSVRISLDSRGIPWHIRVMKRTAKQAAVDAKERIIEAFWRAAREHGSPVAVSLLRRESGLPKDAFDSACLELAAEGRAYLAPHDHPRRLPAGERELLVSDGLGGYFVSFSLRGLNCWRRQPDGTWAPRTAA